MIHTESRKRVMQRSMKLGHCICDPKKSCPCELLKEKNICLCAGERLEAPAGNVRLTQLVEKTGCASKIDQAFLKATLGGLEMPEDKNVIVGVPAGDDAGVYDLGNGRCLVQTVDVFTPTVDDPYTFGQIAAANSLSDVYAMGGTPLTALSIIGFPVRKIADQVMADILRGGIDKMKEAGTAIIGGHSINDAELKAGFTVTGLIDKSKVTTNANARVGDVLILTKALGTGIVSFAAQIGKASPESMAAAAKSMTTLNKTGAELMGACGAHAATDVTGFSLMGHLAEMMLRSGTDAEIRWESLPWLEGVRDYAAQGILPGGIERNKESCGQAVIPGPQVTETMLDMCFDPQTSGGLLIAIEAAQAEALLKGLHEAGLAAASIIGRVKGKGTGKIYLNSDGSQALPAVCSESIRSAASTGIQNEIKTVSAEACCCPENAAGQPAAENLTQPSNTETAYKTFLAANGRPGSLDAFTKQAVNIALAVATRCEPCLKAHLEKARQSGFSEQEIDEAAWMGIAFSGSPAMMFYKQYKK